MNILKSSYSVQDILLGPKCPNTEQLSHRKQCLGAHRLPIQSLPISIRYPRRCKDLNGTRLRLCTLRPRHQRPWSCQALKPWLENMTWPTDPGVQGQDLMSRWQMPLNRPRNRGKRKQEEISPKVSNYSRIFSRILILHIIPNKNTTIRFQRTLKPARLWRANDSVLHLKGRGFEKKHIQHNIIKWFKPCSSKSLAAWHICRIHSAVSFSLMTSDDEKQKSSSVFFFCSPICMRAVHIDSWPKACRSTGFWQRWHGEFMWISSPDFWDPIVWHLQSNSQRCVPVATLRSPLRPVLDPILSPAQLKWVKANKTSVTGLLHPCTGRNSTIWQPFLWVMHSNQQPLPCRQNHHHHSTLKPSRCCQNPEGQRCDSHGFRQLCRTAACPSSKVSKSLVMLTWLQAWLQADKMQMNQRRKPGFGKKKQDRSIKFRQSSQVSYLFCLFIMRKTSIAI